MSHEAQDEAQEIILTAFANAAKSNGLWEGWARHVELMFAKLRERRIGFVYPADDDRLVVRCEDCVYFCNNGEKPVCVNVHGLSQQTDPRAWCSHRRARA